MYIFFQVRDHYGVDAWISSLREATATWFLFTLAQFVLGFVCVLSVIATGLARIDEEIVQLLSWSHFVLPIRLFWLSDEEKLRVPKDYDV